MLMSNNEFLSLESLVIISEIREFRVFSHVLCNGSHKRPFDLQAQAFSW